MRPRLSAAVPLAALLVLLSAPAAAHAAFALSGVTAAPASAQAAAHSDFSIHMGLSGGSIRDLTLHLPPGLVGNPSATPRCTRAQFDGGGCPAATQVGTTSVDTIALGLPVTVNGTISNLEPSGSEPARLGIRLENALLCGPIRLESPASLRADGGLDASLAGIPRDAQVALLLCASVGIDVTALNLTLDATFMTNPSACAPATTRIDATSYDGEPATADASFTPTGCASVPFNPGFQVTPAQQQAGQPGELATTILMPADQSTLRRADVVLPEGTAFSPGLANGLQACADGEFKAGTLDAVACPGASQIGDVTFDTPLLGAIPGKVFLGQPTPQQKLRLFVLVERPGVRVKVLGDVFADATTGQVRAIFDNLPQVPFAAFTLRFFGGPRGVLKAPDACGTFTASARLRPWSGGADATRQGSFTTVSCPPGAFAPSLAAQQGTARAGAQTTLRLRVERADGQANLRSMRISMPPGLAGQIGAVALCDAASASAGSCPAASRVGSAAVSAGTGPEPLTLHGDIFLTGPVDGSLAGLAIVVPASVGPLEFGRVVSLARIDVRPDDVGIDVTTADLPRIVGGIPLAYRVLDLNLDRQGFLANATSCAQQAIRAAFTGVGGEQATAQAAYQPTDCASQPFAPKLSATIGSKGQTAKDSHPPLTTVITQAPGEANSRHVEVTLPAGIGADPKALGRACPIEQLAANACPASATVGSVRAETPLLPVALAGPVVLVKPKDGVLPELSLELHGPIDLRLRATVGFAAAGRLKTVFDGIPDVALSRLALSFTGGKDGILSAARNLCAAPTLKLNATFDSHGGARRTATVPAQVPCGATSRTALKVTASLTGVGHKRPALRLKVAAPARVRALKVKLPAALRSRSGKRTVTIKLRAKKGSRSPDVRLRAGALRLVGALRVGQRVTFTVTAIRVNGKKLTARVPARARA
jgi:hypothetical protein